MSAEKTPMCKIREVLRLKGTRAIPFPEIADPRATPPTNCTGLLRLRGQKDIQFSKTSLPLHPPSFHPRARTRTRAKEINQKGTAQKVPRQSSSIGPYKLVPPVVTPLTPRIENPEGVRQKAPVKAGKG